MQVLLFNQLLSWIKSININSYSFNFSSEFSTLFLERITDLKREINEYYSGLIVSLNNTS